MHQRWRFLATATLVCSCVLAGCSNVKADRGDCNARIRLDGTAFRSHNELNQAAPVGRELGSGEVIDCGAVDDADAVDKVTVYAVEGVDSELAVIVKDPDWFGVFVAEGTPRSAWPAPLEISN